MAGMTASNEETVAPSTETSLQAPNMVTLIGFGFILANVALLQLMIPDLVGPVCLRLLSKHRQELS